MKEALAIRQKVFVLEQKVDPEDEYDTYEESSVHFLAFLDGVPVGAARWRFTAYGVKLERFAVIAEARGNGVGQALVKAVLSDLDSNPETAGKTIYLHSQLKAVSLYIKFGFEKSGDMFEECKIQHFKMKLA